MFVYNLIEKLSNATKRFKISFYVYFLSGFHRLCCILTPEHIMTCRRADALCLCTVTPEILAIVVIPLLITTEVPWKSTCTKHYLLKNVKRFSYSSFVNVIQFVLKTTLHNVRHSFGHLYQKLVSKVLGAHQLN